MTLLATSAALHCLAAPAPAEKRKVEGKVTYLWPIHFSSMPLSDPGGKAKGLESAEFGKKLADIGLRGFKDYLQKTLPKELELDSELAATWNSTDHSRINTAFYRWQKRVFAERHNLPVESLTAKLEDAPHHEGIDYTWPELYDSVEYARFLARVTELSKLYLKRSGMADPPSRFQIFPWVEVFERGDALRPDARIQGAYLAGRYFASVNEGDIKFNFEDPRGINPPFGKTFSHAPYRGNLVLHPVWNSYFVTPNMRTNPVVVLAFLVYPDAGKRTDWRRDVTGGIALNRTFKIGVI